MRFNRNTRSNILGAALNDAFSKREERLKKAAKQIATQIYNHVYSLKVRKQMDELPEGALPTTDDVKVNVNGQVFIFPLPEERPVFNSHTYKPMGVIPADSKLADKIAEHQLLMGKLRDERNELKTKVRSILNSVSTAAQLKKTWPNGAKYLSSESTKVVQLPAVQVEEVDTAIATAKKAA